MGKVSFLRTKGKRKKLTHLSKNDLKKDLWHDSEGNLLDSNHLLISTLLPPAIKEFLRLLEDEVKMLCGERYSRFNEFSRWGQQKGSISLGGQKIALEKPRVRGKNGEEKQLDVYEQFQSGHQFDQQVFIEGLKKVSQRDYEKGLPKIANSFGFKKSTVSKSWVNSTKKKLEEMMNRDIAAMNIVSVFIDGKRFLNIGVVVALGISVTGKKYVLGIYQADTENSTACLELLKDLEKRGLPSRGILFVVDGGSGINKALEQKYSVDDKEKRQAVRIRCHVHKAKNIEDALGKDHSKIAEVRSLFWAMRDAEEYSEAKAHANTLEGIFRINNQSALRSFQEAKEDLLVIHQLGLPMNLKKLFSTTNPIESLNSITGNDLQRVKRWKNSEQFQRWLATSALNAEKRMRRIKGFKALSVLQKNLQTLCNQNIVDENKKVA